MALGKTLLAIYILELARKEKGAFLLVIYPSVCRQHYAAYKEVSSQEVVYKSTLICYTRRQGQAPNVLVHISFYEIIESRVEVIMILYHYSYQAINNAITNFHDFRNKLRTVKQDRYPGRP
jgi:hypothetical protein